MPALEFRRSALVAAACFAGGILVAGASTTSSLFVIPTDSPPSAAVADGQPLRIELQVRDPAALARVLGIAPPGAGTDELDYVMSGYPAIQGVAVRDWIKPTFVIDYDEPSMVKLSAEFSHSLDDKQPRGVATLNQLVSFVGGIMHLADSPRFDVASEVAVHREGNCKAVAVLTVALARSVGIPARAVFGMALVHVGDRYQAFGHLWAELKIDGSWVVADAAVGQAGNAVRYLPYGVLENEGMGFSLELGRLTPLWVQHVKVLGSPSGAAVSQ